MFRNSVLRVAIARNPPEAFDDCLHFPIFEQSRHCPYPGWCLEVLYMLSLYLNVTIKPVIPDYPVGSVDWGNLNGTTWSGVLGMIQNDTVDTACLMYQKTQTREEYFDFATSVVSVQPVYVTKRREPTFMSAITKVFHTFQTQLWIIMFIAVVVQIVFMLVVVKVEYEMGREPLWQPQRLTWEMFRFFVRQGEEGTYDRYTKAGNILMIIWGLASMLMLGLYEGLLLTQLLHPPKLAPFANADEMIDLVAKKQFKLVTNNRANWYFDDMRNSNWSHFIKLRGAVADNPVEYVTTVNNALDLVENSNSSAYHYIYPVQQDSIAMQFAKKRCNLAYISEGLPSKFAYFAFAKNSSWIGLWNKALVQQQSFQMRTFDKYFNSDFIIGERPNCTENIYEETDIIRPLDAKSLTGVCLVYLCGIAVAIFSGFCEYPVFHKQKWFNKKLSDNESYEVPFNDINGKLAKVISSKDPLSCSLPSFRRRKCNSIQ